MGLDASKLILTFQSRFGFDEWLQPYTDKTIEKLAKDGVKRIAVVTPGFSADCLETLEEIAQENAEIFKHNGGEQFAAIPCLNDSDPGMDVIRQLVLRELAGLDYSCLKNLTDTLLPFGPPEHLVAAKPFPSYITIT